jgi:hypothetical protein
VPNSVAALSGPDQAIEDALERFDADPAHAMDAPLPKFDGDGNLVSRERGLKFAPDAIESGEAIAARDRFRLHKGMAVPGRSEIRGNDLPEQLVDRPEELIYSLKEMENRSLMRSTLSVHPWSDDYWGLYQGLVAARYADPLFPATEHWRTNRKYVEKYPASTIVASSKPGAIDVLAPAEKYERLIGDKAFALTQAMWKRGETFADSHGNVETWIGLCDGWSQASMMLPRPVKTVVLTASDEHRTPVRIYPSDAKALATLLWSRGNAPIRFVGGRCDVKKPEKDKHGRIVNQDCFDTNPGAWHLSVVNQLGVFRRALLMDATFDYEVWNQPLLGYQYRYFNPQSRRVSRSLQGAAVPIARFARDKFKAYRSKKTVSIVGVAMELTYIEETDPSHEETDSDEQDATRKVTYLYDLELDRSGNVIGGEWYSNLHPDFLWVPEQGAHAVSVAEELAIGDWDGTTQLPESWREAALTAERSWQPLGKLVESILLKAAD